MYQENVNVINAAGTLLNITIDHHTGIILLSKKFYAMKKSLKQKQSYSKRIP